MQLNEELAQLKPNGLIDSQDDGAPEPAARIDLPALPMGAATGTPADSPQATRLNSLAAIGARIAHLMPQPKKAPQPKPKPVSAPAEAPKPRVHPRPTRWFD